MGKEYASKQGLHHTFYQCDGHLFRLQKREIPPGIRYTGGSDWFVLHRQFVDYVINPPVDDELVNDLVSYFAFTILPAETYFATLIDASKFCGVHKRTDLRYVSWDRKKGGCFCKEKSTVDWCGCSPLVIRNVTSKWFYHDNVLNNTVDENSRFFARKFDPVVSLSAINHLAEKLPQSFGNSSASDASWSSFWLNFFHADFDNTKSPLLLAANWLGNISMSKLQLKFPQDFSQLTHAASRGDHYFINDSYSGDVWTFRDTGSDRLLQTPYLQLYMLPRGKLDYFDDRYFHSSLQISANFDAKENISRSFNNRLTTLDTVWTIFAKFSDANVRQRLNQTFHVRLKRGVDTHVSKIVHPRVGDTYFVADFYLHPEKIKPGVWKAQVKNSAESIIATREFVVMGSRIDSASLKEASNFWLLSGYCVGGDWNQESVLPSFSSCESQPWSLYYPDRKSLSTQNRLVI